MYNPGLFFPRQEYKMPAKKAASKKRKKTATSRKKSVTKKSTAKKKVARKKPASRKKAPARGKASKKKAASKKKVARKKAPVKKKVSKKKVAKKKVAKKKATRKKPVKKKAPAKKAARKKVTKKKASTKKAAAKKPTAKKAVSRKKAASRKKAPARPKSVSRKRAPVGKATPRRAPARRPAGNVLTGPIHGIAPYKAKRGEDYMSDEQLEHFRKILTSWKRELMFEVDRTVHHMQDEAANFPDPNDRATQESEFGLELRTRDRERKLLRKIDQALLRIDEGSYGYCEDTGEEIGLKRLEARPVATLSLEAQERRELAERQYRDRDDRYR